MSRVLTLCPFKRSSMPSRYGRVLFYFLSVWISSFRLLATVLVWTTVHMRSRRRRLQRRRPKPSARRWRERRRPPTKGRLLKPLHFHSSSFLSSSSISASQEQEIEPQHLWLLVNVTSLDLYLLGNDISDETFHVAHFVGVKMGTKHIFCTSCTWEVVSVYTDLTNDHNLGRVSDATKPPSRRIFAPDIWAAALLARKRTYPWTLVRQSQNQLKRRWKGSPTPAMSWAVPVLPART